MSRSSSRSAGSFQRVDRRISVDSPLRRERWVGTVLASLLAACANDPSTAAEASESSPLIAAASSDRIEIHSVSAMGSGCPPGTWRIDQGGGGSSTLSFTSFGLHRDDVSEGATRNCSLALKLTSDASSSYALTSVTLAGVSEGAVTYDADLYWAGAPEARAGFQHRSEGYHDFTHNLRDLWSPCSRSHVLHVALAAWPSRRSEATASYSLRAAQLAFAAKACDAPVTPPGTDEKPVGPPGARQPATPTIASVEADGVGCPPGTVHSEIAADGHSITAMFDQLSIAARPTDTNPYTRINCDLLLTLPEDGKAYAVDTISLTGAASLDEGVIARIYATHGWAGRGFVTPQKQVELAGPLRGPLSLDFTFGDDNGEELCVRDRPVQIGLQLFVHNVPRRSADVSLTLLDGVKFVVRPCRSG